MKLYLQRSIVIRGVLSALFILVLSLVLNFAFIGFSALENLIWPVLFSIGLGGYTSWEAMNKTKKSFIKELTSPYWYIEVEKTALPEAMAQTFDDYEVQLVARGYRAMGNFTTSNINQAVEAFVRVFVNADETQLIEVQQFRLISNNSAIPESIPGIHFSIGAVVAGQIHVGVTDHEVQAVNYLLRGDYTAVASYPNMPLLDLLEKHRRLVAYICEKNGHSLSDGLTMTRNLLFERERRAQALSRIKIMSGWTLAGKVDKFQAAPKTQWSASPDVLKQLEPRSLSWFDTSEYVLPRPIVWLTEQATPQTGMEAEAQRGESADQIEQAHDEVVHSENAATEMAIEGNPPSEAMQSTPVLDDATMERVASAASWFYWIAALTVVGAIASVMGSDWGFAIGLGSSQILTMLAMPSASADLAIVMVGLMWLVNIGLITLFMWLGYVARRPSLVAFMIGMALYLLDTLIFVFAGDWLGVIFHGVALYFLFSGWSLARTSLRSAT